MGCDYFREINYAELDNALSAKVLAERIPLSGAIELTHRCNLNCAHCYCNQPQDSREIIQKESNTAQVIDILNQCSDHGCLWLLFTGGEPLLRRDFTEIYTFAKNKGFLITLFTNATLITPEFADLFKDLPPAKLEVTLYGASCEIYEKITRVPGSFAKCLQGMEYLRQKNVAFDLKTMVMTLNHEDLPRIRQIAENFHAGFRIDPLLHRRLDGSSRPRDFRLSSQETVALDLTDEKRRRGWKMFLEAERIADTSNRLFICGAGRNMFFIDPYANMSVCSMALKPDFNLKEHSFTRIWDEFFPKIVNREYAGEIKCKNCEAELYCDYCPGWSLIENNDPESIVEYLCEIANLRKQKFVDAYPELVKVKN